MPNTYTDTAVASLVINKMTQEQYDALAEKSDTELYLIDGGETAVYAEQMIEMPNAEAAKLGNIIQYAGLTDQDYTNGYFYKCNITSGSPASVTITQTIGSSLSDLAVNITTFENYVHPSGDETIDFEYVVIPGTMNCVDTAGEIGIACNNVDEFIAGLATACGYTVDLTVENLNDSNSIFTYYPNNASDERLTWNMGNGSWLPDTLLAYFSFAETPLNDISWTTSPVTQGSYYWSDGFDEVNLLNYGIVYSGTPVGGDEIEVDYVASTAVYSWVQLNVQPGVTVVDNYGSTSTTSALSANMGHDLNERLTSVEGRGRYLSTWDCTTGLAGTNPPESPYTYKAGDYFIVSTVGVTNYKPSGSSYTTGVASSTVETGTVKINDTYQFDGTNWTLLNNTAGDVLPSQSGNSGKFLTTDGTTTSWGEALVNKRLASQTGDLVIGDNASANGAQEGATAVGQYAQSGSKGTSVGYAASASSRGTAIGNNAQTTDTYATAIGMSAKATATNAIQLGVGANGADVTNANANTFKVGNANGNFELMSADGTIPEARLASMSGVSAGQGLVLDNNLNAVWGNIDPLPSQSGHAGKVLTTNGVYTSWTELIKSPTTAPVLLGGTGAGAWDSSTNTQTVTVQGVTSTNAIFISPAPASSLDYATAGVICTNQNLNSLTFSCNTIPVNDLTVNVVILG